MCTSGSWSFGHQCPWPHAFREGTLATHTLLDEALTSNLYPRGVLVGHSMPPSPECTARTLMGYPAIGKAPNDERGPKLDPEYVTHPVLHQIVTRLYLWGCPLLSIQEWVSISHHAPRNTIKTHACIAPPLMRPKSNTPWF